MVMSGRISFIALSQTCLTPWIRKALLNCALQAAVAAGNSGGTSAACAASDCAATSDAAGTATTFLPGSSGSREPR